MTHSLRSREGLASHPLRRSGQVMLLSMLVLGGILLGASTLAGLLMLYQIRQTSNASLSAQAIFAADTGIEWGLYCVVKIKPLDCASVPKPVMTNGTSFDVAFSPATSTPQDGYESMRSVAASARTSRAFQLFFECATSTLP